MTTNGTTTYGYDYAGQRVSKNSGATTTIYANSLYEIKDSTVTKHIYAGDMLVASVEEDTPAPVIYHNHLDHLNSTNAVTGDDGYLNQLNAYYPFGGSRIDNTYDTVRVSKQYTGHTKDDETDLLYMGARYYDGQIGRFTSQDPLHIRLDNPNLLTNPQRMNSYGYALNNPIIYDDPTGESASFSGFMGFTAPRVDNLSGGYIRSDVAAKQQGAVQLGRAAAYTGAGVASVGVAGAGLYYAPALTIGALTNMGVGAYEDSLDGAIDDGYGEYATRGVIGGVAGRFTGGRGLPVLGSVAAGESVLTQGLTGDHQINGREVVVDTGVAVGLRGGQSLLTPTSQSAAHSSFAGSFSQLVTELSAKVAAFEAFVRGSEKDNNDEHE